MNRKRFAVVLAAGKGTRMKSDVPKVLHPVCGTSMLQHIINKLKKIDIDEIYVVVGHKSDLVKASIQEDVIFVEQQEQRGTAHAVMQVSQYLNQKEGDTLIITGDTPLIEIDTLESLFTTHHTLNSKGTVLFAKPSNPFGYGRIIQNKETSNPAFQVASIVQEKDANEQQKQISEVDTGITVFDNKTLFTYVHDIKTNNSQNEYYITDMVEILNQSGIPYHGHPLQNSNEVLGINSKVQLSEAEMIMRKNINERHMNNGVTLIDPTATYIDNDVTIGSGTVIYPGAVITGKTTIGKGVIIKSGTEISDSTIGDNVLIRQSVIFDSRVEDDVQIGPFAHIRPKSILKTKSKIGNFVETKAAEIGEKSKVNHLSYIGDTEVGSGVNIGCGSITVNYDGKNKHKTIIEDGAFIGCNTNLIAPVTVGKNSLIAAGSTITKDVPDEAMGIARALQTNKEKYSKIFKEKISLNTK